MKSMSTHIKKASALNWQGKTFAHPLTPLTAIIGSNLSGKSSILNLLRVGLLGYSPAHGKTNGANWGFAGNPNGATNSTIELQFADGKINAHSWKLNRGKVEYVAELGLKVPPVMIDLHEEFFALSGPKRVNLVFSKMDATALGLTSADITARLKREIKIENPTAETEAMISNIVEDVESLDGDRHESSWTPQQFVDQITEQFKSRSDTAKQTLSQMAGTIQGTTVLRSGEKEERFDKVALAKAREKLSDLVARKKTGENNAATVARLNANLRSYSEALANIPDASEEIAKAEAEIKTLEEKTSSFRENRDARDEATKIEAEIGAIDAKIDLINGQVEEENAQLATHKKSECCPLCKSKGAGWKAALKKREKEIADKVKEVEKLQAEKAKADKKLSANKSKIAESLKHVQENASQLSKLAQARRKLETVRASSSKVSVVHYLTGTDGSPQEMEIAQARARLDGFKSQLNDIAGTVTETPPTEEEHKVAKDNVEALEGAERRMIASQNDDLRAEEARQKHASATAEKQVADLALKVMASLKKEKIEEGFKTFIKKVNKFCDGLTKAPLEFRDGDIGYQNGATWVTVDYFCGTEKMLTYIGLSVALAEESPVKIVFCDEWLRDSDFRVRVPMRLAELVKEGVIDQAVVIDTDAKGFETLGYSIVNP